MKKLPDYNDIEVKMEPLVKAVFFLFLKHPEGIVFKELADYREVLLGIYKELKPMGLNKRTIQSIEDVTNPILNSINEKCARIRGVFVGHFGHPTLLLPDPLQVKYDNVIWKYDWRNEKSASRNFYSEHRNKNSDTRIV